MDKNILLKSGYRRFEQAPDEPTLYQNKICDEKGVKYFINCFHYIFQNRDSWKFSLQLSSTFGMINIELSNTDDISLKNIETFMECEWINHKAKYYELFSSSEVSN